MQKLYTERTCCETHNSAWNSGLLFNWLYGSDLQKSYIIRNSFYCTIMFWALKAFFSSNIKSVLQRNSQLQAVKARDAIHGFACIPMAINITHI